MSLLKKTDESAAVAALRKEVTELKKEVTALKKELSKKPAAVKGADPRVDVILNFMKNHSPFWKESLEKSGA